jgi:hypothetical protein
MLEAAIHLGIDYAGLTATVVFGILSFVVGIGLGTFSDRFQDMIRTLITGSAK